MIEITGLYLVKLRGYNYLIKTTGLQNNGVLKIIVLKTNNNSFRMLLQCLNHQNVFKNTHFEGSKSCPVVLLKIAKTCPVVFLEM